MRQFLILPLLVLFAAACSGAAEEQEGLTKDEARARGGKADDGYDFCAAYGWYGDGICDVFCVHPDPDCPGVEYCYSDTGCPSHQECNAVDVCLSLCSGDEICPAVCAGYCVDKPAAFCGGIAGFTCDGGKYCDYPIETSCGSGDQGGTCKDKPDFCYELFAPVCGCDGNTYGNDCKAAAAGVSIAAMGTCDDPAPAASCEGNCGTHAPAKVCYCDTACTGYGDCCDDYSALCVE